MNAWQEGIEDGRMEGRAEGRAEGRIEGRIAALDIQDRRREFPAESYELTAEAVGCTVDEVRLVVEHKPRTWRR